MDIDHLVFAGPELDAAADHVASQLGVVPVAGGRHLGRGTHNRLVALGGTTYLEVIGPDPTQPEPDAPRPFGIDGLAQPRLVAWAVRSMSLDSDVARARAAGLDPGPIASMERAQPDGELLQWRLTPPRGGVVPFIIDWGTTPHPSTRLPRGPRLRSLRIEARDAAAVRNWLAVLDIAAGVTAAAADRLAAVIDVDGRQAILA